MEEKENINNIPNKITAVRFLIAIPTLLLALSNQFGLAALCFGIGAGSDGIDGYLARKFNQKTKFGAKFDALTDKLFLVSALPIVAINPVLIINLLFEGFISVINLLNKDAKTHEIGRKKTVILFGTMLAAFMSSIPELSFLKEFIKIGFGATLVLQVASLNEYYKSYKEYKKNINNVVIENNVSELDELVIKEKEKALVIDNKLDKKDYYKDHPLQNINNENVIPKTKKKQLDHYNKNKH